MAKLCYIWWVVNGAGIALWNLLNQKVFFFVDTYRWSSLCLQAIADGTEHIKTWRSSWWCAGWFFWLRNSVSIKPLTFEHLQSIKTDLHVGFTEFWVPGTSLSKLTPHSTGLCPRGDPHPTRVGYDLGYAKMQLFAIDGQTPPDFEVRISYDFARLEHRILSLKTPNCLDLCLDRWCTGTSWSLPCTFRARVPAASFCTPRLVSGPCWFETFLQGEM